VNTINTAGALSNWMNQANTKTPSAKVKDAAEQFEALMMSELLKTSREASSDSGWMGTGDDQAGQTSLDMAEQQVASVMAKAGGLGMREFIMRGLKS
jgi:Rod binding domain-containing protein